MKGAISLQHSTSNGSVVLVVTAAEVVGKAAATLAYCQLSKSIFIVMNKIKKHVVRYCWKHLLNKTQPNGHLYTKYFIINLV